VTPRRLGSGARFTPIDAARSSLMKRVGRHGTAAETSVAGVLTELGARYRRNVRGLPGTPDFVNRTRGWALFVHGCFWHGHAPCPRATLPKHNRALWREKLKANRERDDRKRCDLEAVGLRVMTVWECELKDTARLRRRLAGHVLKGETA
jgi:DNA mismatch endonuclease, patch repair protein